MQSKRFPIISGAVMISNLKQNWWFPLSAFALFCLHANLKTAYILGMLIAFFINLLIATQIPSLRYRIKKKSIGLQLFSLATAAGICLGGQKLFLANQRICSKLYALGSRLPISIDVPFAVSLIGAIASMPFVYYCVFEFWCRITSIFVEHNILNDVRISEWFIYVSLAALSIGFMVYTFNQTQAFYGTEHKFNIIYTSDSPSLLKGNVYLSLTHPENDLRQPLFAVFASPFIGIVNLFVGVSATQYAILSNSVQIVLLFAANFLLAKTLGLDRHKRIFFILLTVCTYSYLLFILMMEQYIIAYFWLILTVYLTSEHSQPPRIVMWGAGGTLLTSMVLLPFISGKSLLKDFKLWLDTTLRYGFGFIALMLAFCRFDVIYHLTERVSSLSSFAGKTVTLSDKIYQFSTFIRNCFLAPNAGINRTVLPYVSWQLNRITSISPIGILILVLAAISAVLNWEKLSSRLASGWALFSIIILLVLGWGTRENGLILYSLYFGWAFLVLLFQLVEWIEKRLGTKYLVPTLTVLVAAILLVKNYPAILKMIDFAIVNYPT